VGRLLLGPHIRGGVAPRHPVSAIHLPPVSERSGGILVVVIASWLSMMALAPVSNLPACPWLTVDPGWLDVGPNDATHSRQRCEYTTGSIAAREVDQEQPSRIVHATRIYQPYRDSGRRAAHPCPMLMQRLVDSRSWGLRSRPDGDRTA
jgi:hypothetical protein